MFLFYLIFNFRMIASQCCVGSCCTTTWFSHKYTYIPPSGTFLPSPHPILLSHHRAPGCLCVLVAQLCPTLCNSWTLACPGSFVYGSLQARILEWVAILFSRERWSTSVIQQIPTSYLFHTWWCIYLDATLNSSCPLLSPLCPQSILYACVSISALQIGSPVAFF